MFVLGGFTFFLDALGNFMCVYYSDPNLGGKYPTTLHNLQDHTVIYKGSLPPIELLMGKTHLYCCVKKSPPLSHTTDINEPYKSK